MLKKLFLITALIFNLLAQESNEVEKIPRSELEAFIFKMGFESLLKDVEKDKQITLTNQAKIDIIQKEIQKNRQDLNYLLEQSSEAKVKQGLSIKTNSEKIEVKEDEKTTSKDKIIQNQKEQISSLKHDIDILKSIVIKLKKADDKRKKKSQNIQKLSLDDKLSKIAKVSDKKVNKNNKNTKNKKQYPKAIVKRAKAKLRAKPFFGAVELRDITKGEVFQISRCDKFGWCKVAYEKQYIPKFVLKFK